MESRTQLMNEKRNFKKLTANKKRKHKQNITNKLSQTHVSQREFWKILDNLSEKKANVSSFVSHHAMTNHFKTLLNSKEKLTMPPRCQERGAMDHQFTLDELKKGSEFLK